MRCDCLGPRFKLAIWNSYSGDDFPKFSCHEVYIINLDPSIIIFDPMPLQLTPFLTLFVPIIPFLEAPKIRPASTQKKTMVRKTRQTNPLQMITCCHC